jgi:P-type conjugative transfer protein TrbJ
MIQDMVHNTMNMPNQLFAPVAQVYNGIKDVMSQTQGIAYQLGNFDTELKNKLKSYSDLSSMLQNAPDFQREYKKIIDTQRETTQDTLKSLKVMGDDMMNNDSVILEQLQNKAKSADGRNEILQAGNQFLNFIAADLMKLRQLMMMQSQMTGVAIEAERSKEDVNQVQYETMNKPIQFDTTTLPALDWIQ